MPTLTSSQAKYLRGLAHNLKPVVFVGQKGVNPAVLESVREALAAHELIKVRFRDLDDRRILAQGTAEVQRQTDSFLAGAIGHVAIFYRPHPDPEKRKISLPR
jgi:RNA-binding protein